MSTFTHFSLNNPCNDVGFMLIKDFYGFVVKLLLVLFILN
uniref:Uncharacterized protein n=1 Tax=Lepeophtheirus salmonis TaxID=72036 RepID=A0A0K2UV39_LEPSM